MVAALPAFKAAQEIPSVAFKFTAADTAIKDGQFQFTIPSGWGPTPTTADAAGNVAASADAAGNVAASDIDKKFIKFSGSGNRTVTITVEKMTKGGDTIITYMGKDAAKITVQPNATAVDKPVVVNGILLDIFAVKQATQCRDRRDRSYAGRRRLRYCDNKSCSSK